MKKNREVKKKRFVSGGKTISVRTRATLSIVLIAATVITAGLLVGIFVAKDNLTDTIEADMLVVGNIVDSLVSTEINLLRADGMNIATNLNNASPEEVHKILVNAVESNDKILALTVFNLNGIVDEYGTVTTPEKYRNLDYVQRAFNGETVISTTRQEFTGELVLHVCLPINRDQVLSITIDGFYFSNLIEPFTIWETGHVFICDAEGVMIANPNKEWVKNRYNAIDHKNDAANSQEMIRTFISMTNGETGVTKFHQDGELFICAYQPISASTVGWSVGVMAPFSESPATKMMGGILLVGLVCIVLSALASMIAGRIIERPFAEMKRQENFLTTINGATSILLRATKDDFEDALQRCLGILATGVGVDRIRIMKNYEKDGELLCSPIYGWDHDRDYIKDEKGSFSISYDREIPNWKTVLSSGGCVKGSVADMDAFERKWLSKNYVVSLIAVPIFHEDSFWGFIALSDCHNIREFSDEENILRSGGLLFSNALLRNEMMIELIQAREEAVSSTQAKSDFLATISHEMRTPLNAIIGLSELILNEGSVQGEAFNNLGRVYGSGMTLLSLINDILDISKIEAGKFELIPVDYDIPSLINDTAQLNIVRIGSKRINFNIDIDGSLPDRLYGDELRIKQIFNNLLSNAFKYTEVGTVTWSLKTEKEGGDIWLVSSVKDTGIGIRSEDMEKLFADFGQLDTKRNRKIEGTGLGLTITKRLVEMMGSTLMVESVYGEGSTFTVRLKQGKISELIIGEEVANNLKSLRYSDQKRDRSATMVRAHIPYARVLVVDDVETNLDVAKGMMKPYGMEIDCVTGGEDAIQLIKNDEIRYDAVFMDHMMPGMDGIEAVRIIREELGTEYAKTVPIIALTANAILGNEEMFLNNGFQAFLSKPIDIMRLDVIINQWVRDKEQEKANRDQNPGASEPATPEEPMLFCRLFQIDGLDVHSGIARFGNDKEAYLIVLKSFLKNTPSLLDKMAAYRETSLPNYAITVHGIKSSSRSIGAEAFGSVAEKLEHAAKSNDEAFIQANGVLFEQKLRAWIENIHILLSEEDETQDAPLKPAPEKKSLEVLKEACLAYDIDAIEAALQDLEKYRYESGGDLIVWLRKQSDVFAYKQIEIRLGEEENEI